jgi:hypothetical protein
MISAPRRKNLGAIPYKQLLTQYHQSLMRILRAYFNAENSQSGQKNMSAAEAGIDFALLVGDFDLRHGHLFRDKSN